MLLSADINYAIEQVTANPELLISKETLIIFAIVLIIPLIVSLLIPNIMKCTITMKYTITISRWFEYIILVVLNIIVGEILLPDVNSTILLTALLLIDWLIHIMISKI